MLKKLRYKFILIAMVSLVAVLAVIVTDWSVLNFVGINQRADRILDILLSNGGGFPGMDVPGSGQNPGEDSVKPPENESGMPGGGNSPDTGGEETGNGAGTSAGDPGTGGPAPGKDPSEKMPHGMSPETPYNSRYFSVTIASDGTVRATDTGHIAAVGEEEARELAKRVRTSGKTSGYVGVYRYGVRSENDTITVVFLDESVELSAFRSSLFTGIAVSGAGMAVVLLLLILLSGRAVRPFAENYEKQKHFITDAGHELKTPLTVIGANVEVIEMENGESEWTKSIRNQVERLSGLTRNLIRLARMNEEGEKRVFADFSLTETVRSAAEEFRAPAAASGRTLCVRAEDGILLRGDEGAIRQTVGLLLDNAVKYADGDGDITLMLTRVGKRAELTVTNPCRSVAEGVHDEFFERFYRADASRNSETGGSGIGLSVVRAVAVAHGGKADFRSPDGKSVSVRVILPLRGK